MKPNTARDRFPHPIYRFVCYAEVEFSDGSVQQRHVIVSDKAGKVVCSYPLEKEEPFTEWRNERFVVTEEMLS